METMIAVNCVGLVESGCDYPGYYHSTSHQNKGYFSLWRFAEFGNKGCLPNCSV